MITNDASHQSLSRLPVLVTGAQGSIGNAVSRTLHANGASILGMDLVPPTGIDVEIFHRHYTMDLREFHCLERAVSEAEVVVHLAAWVHRLPRSREDIAKLYDINVGATKEICDVCEREGKRIIFASTVAVYGEEIEGQMNEESMLAPVTQYAKSKLQAEKIVLASGGVVLRLPMVYGARDRGNAARMIAAIQRGWFVVPGRGLARRDFVGRWNVAHAVLRAMSGHNENGKTYLVTDGETMTVAKFADLIADISGCRQPRRIPLPVIKAAAHVGSIIGHAARSELPLNISSFRKLTRDVVFDCSRIREDCGYSPIMSVKEGLEEEIEWCRSARR